MEVVMKTTTSATNYKVGIIIDILFISLLQFAHIIVLTVAIS